VTHVTGNAMPEIIAVPSDGRLIEAIKQFRAAYGAGLKEANLAIEAIRDAFMPDGLPDLDQQKPFVPDDDYVVVIRNHTSRCPVLAKRRCHTWCVSSMRRTAAFITVNTAGLLMLHDEG